MLLLKILPQIALGLWGILPGNYSGIARVCNNMYAVVDDKDSVDGFKLLTLDIDSVKGKIHHASLTEPSVMVARREQGLTNYRDCEGIAYFNDAQTLFVSGEEDQRVLEYALDGTPTGRELPIPPSMQRGKIASNLGFEALTYNAQQQRFWTTTESTLPADGKQASAKNPDVRNRLRFISFDKTLRLRESYVYQMDLPTARKQDATSIHGVPAMLALDDGRLIVMEREGYFPKGGFGSWVKIKLYLVSPLQEQPVSLSTPMSNIPESHFMQKTLLCSFSTGIRVGQLNLSNYEGMCLGPRLTNGRQTVLLIADSQNGKGNRLYHVKDHMRVIVLNSDY